MAKRAYLKNQGIRQTDEITDSKEPQSFENPELESETGIRPAKLTAWQRAKNSKTASVLWKNFVTTWGHDPANNKKRR